MKDENTITTDYYDAIAKEYDSKMDIDSNNNVRQLVRDYFIRIPDVRKVLDFGAGTGNDLEWQLEAGYELFFYEPSSKMALVANEKYNIENHQQVKVLIGSDATYQILRETLDEELDAVFSNFAVFNSIKALNDLFAMLSKTLKREGHLVCVLYDDLNSVDRLKSHLFPQLPAKATYVASSDSNQRMVVYSHAKKHLLKAATANNFKFYDEVKLASSGHKLYHFIKN